VERQQEPNVQIERPGISDLAHFLIEPVYDLGLSSPVVVIGGTPGSYTATFVLSMPGKEVYRGEADIDPIFGGGESLLLAPTHDERGHEIQSVRVPISMRHDLYQHPNAPVIGTVVRIYDQPG
jgi:hypothetical protein